MYTNVRTLYQWTLNKKEARWLVVFRARTRCSSSEFGSSHSRAVGHIRRGKITPVVGIKTSVNSAVAAVRLTGGCSFVCTTIKIRPDSVTSLGRRAFT